MKQLVNCREAIVCKTAWPSLRYRLLVSFYDDGSLKFFVQSPNEQFIIPNTWEVL
jgi:hypothetical protein